MTDKLTETMEAMSGAAELAEDILDAIAVERDHVIDSKNTWICKMEQFIAAGNKEEAGRASVQAEHHATAATALITTLNKCQRIVDDWERKFT